MTLSWDISLAVKPNSVGVAGVNMQWAHFVSHQKRENTAFELVLWIARIPVSKLVEVVLHVGKGPKFGVLRVRGCWLEPDPSSSSEGAGTQTRIEQSALLFTVMSDDSCWYAPLLLALWQRVYRLNLAWWLFSESLSTKFETELWTSTFWSCFNYL